MSPWSRGTKRHRGGDGVSKLVRAGNIVGLGLGDSGLALSGQNRQLRE